MLPKKPQRRNWFEPVLVTATSILFVVSNYWHVIYEWGTNTSDHVYHAIAHYYIDYFLYLSHVAQGANGQLFRTHHMFTGETLPTTTIYWVYSLIGFFGHIIGLTPVWSYHLSLVLLTMLLCFLWYLFCRFLYPGKVAMRLITFIVVMSASPFINPFTLEFPKNLWFSPAPAFNRLGGVPHQIIQTIALLLVLFGLSKTKHIKDYVLLALISFIAAYAHPLQMALLLIAAGTTALLTDIKRLLPVCIAGAISIPAALIINHEYETPIYAIAKQWELMQYTPKDILWWIAAMGPIALFIPFGIWPFIKKRDPFHLTFFLYGLFSVLCYNSFVPKLISVIPQRFLHPASYALFPVLAVSGFFAVQKDLPRILGRLCIVIAIGVYAAFTIPAAIKEVLMRINDPMLIESVYLNHTPVSVVNTLKSFQEMKQDNYVVLAQKELGIDLLVPLYTNRTSFMGQPIHTLYPNEKEAVRQNFFEGGMTADEKRKFLTDHRIGYAITKSDTGIRITKISP